MNKKNIIKKVFTENLPKKQGIGSLKDKIVVDWINSKGYKVKFIYDDIVGWLEIIKFDKSNKKLFIKYNENDFEINISSFINCQLGRILKIRTSEFKYEVGSRFQDDKRDITILDKKYNKVIKNSGNKENKKYYKYHCNKCNHESWMVEGDFLKGTGCSVCANRISVEGVNDIPTTDPWMIPYFQGGYEEAKLYTSGTTKSIHPICPDCGRVKDRKVIIRNIKKYKSIQCTCSDSISYIEKAMYSILEQLNIDFKTQLSKRTFKWCYKYRYDFYFELNNEKYICEVNGLQHYEDAWSKLEKTQLNDKSKKELALANGIKEANYIVIDCRYSEMEWIKNNILDSKMAELFNLSIIDWIQVEKFSLSNRVKEACMYKNTNSDLTTTKIGKLMKLHRCTIQRYLAKGEQVGWCEYSIQEEKNKNKIKIVNLNKKQKSKMLEIFKNDVSLGKFSSTKELSRCAEELFGIKLAQSMISKACLLNITYKGYKMKYI